ncbi:uncharacterized protein LTR77_007050 [Saxophila tyrrhenica]|uniref:Major facilitator superfamily (MFS) profile domain-containing protein n=1 Tax=Saxophila tyrrhenica TaxID=1690608 RepID=A0AAV9P3L8_9PEZI|nr:hypothetical protein LTR77_007050 [Saxophila tyrrhenica]
MSANSRKSNVEQGAAYSTFTRPQAILTVCLVALAGFFSPFTAFTYFPSLHSISKDFHVSLELMNVTVTVYLVVQGIVPPLLGDISDGIGRRPVYLSIFTLYCAASIGLALQRDYAALLVLRMIQSAGSSATIALGYGVIGDIAAPHERGKYVGLSVMGFNSAPALGPVVGGLITDRAGWPWIFVFLATASATLLILLALFFYETARSIVDNGSIPPQRFNWNILQFLQKGRRDEPPKPVRLRAPNVVPCLKLIFHKNTLPVLLANATFYMTYSFLQATTAPLLQQLYGLSPLQAGLCYLPYGVAGAVASVRIESPLSENIKLTTYWLITDRDYRITAKQHNLSIDRLRGDNILHFPIEKARLRSVWIYVTLGSTCVIGYGWSLTARTHLAVPLILQFVIGFAVTGVFNISNTLIVDVQPDRPVTASASVSITRCIIAAGGVVVVQVVMNALGSGWTFTLIGGLCWATLPMYWIVRANGWEWRKRKAEQSVTD